MSEGSCHPPGWSAVTIDLLLEPFEDGRLVHHGWSPQCEAEPSASDEEWAVLKTTAIQDGLYLQEHNKRLPGSLAPREHLEVHAGDLLLTCAGPRNRCGIACLVRHTRPKLILSGKMYRFRPRREVLDAAFLESFLRSQAAQVAIDAMKTGINDSGLNLTHGRFKRLLVPVAPLNEQRRIVAKIEELFSDLDAGVAALERAKANLKRYRVSVLKAAVEGKLTEAWRAEHPEVEPASKLLERILAERRQKWEADQLAKFAAAAGKQPPKNWQAKYKEPAAPDTTNLPELPEGWCWASVEQLSSYEKYSLAIGPFGSNLKVTDYRQAGVPLVFVRNIRGADFGHDCRQYISNEKAVELYGHTISGGDVLVTKMGDPPGDACLYPEGEPTAVITADCIKFRVNPKLVSSKFAVHAINSLLVKTQIRELTKGVAQQKVSLARFSTVAIPLARLDEQNRLISELHERFSECKSAETAIEHSLFRARRLRQSILKQAFEGKLVPQDPNDEPASVLLERIRAERGAHETNGKAKASAKGKASARPRLGRTKSKQA